MKVADHLRRILSPGTREERREADDLLRAALSNRQNRRKFNHKLGRTRGRGYTTPAHGPARTRGGK